MLYGFPNEATNVSTNSNTSLQNSSTKKSNIPHSSLHTSALMETTSGNHVTQELPIISKHQLKSIFRYAVQSTDKTTVSHLEKSHNCLEHAILICMHKCICLIFLFILQLSISL